MNSQDVLTLLCDQAEVDGGHPICQRLVRYNILEKPNENGKVCADELGVDFLQTVLVMLRDVPSEYHRRFDSDTIVDMIVGKLVHRFPYSGLWQSAEQMRGISTGDNARIHTGSGDQYNDNAKHADNGGAFYENCTINNYHGQKAKPSSQKDDSDGGGGDPSAEEAQKVRREWEIFDAWEYAREQGEGSYVKFANSKGWTESEVKSAVRNCKQRIKRGTPRPDDGTS